MQASFADVEYVARKKQTRRERFLTQLVTPPAQLGAALAPLYPAGTGPDRPPPGLSRRLRMYVAQQCFELSDEGIEDALYDSYAIGRFVGIDLTREGLLPVRFEGRFRRRQSAHCLHICHSRPAGYSF